MNYGIYIYGDTSRGNVVRGNYIGKNYLGTSAVPNSRGIVISHSNKNTIGGTDQFSGNLISGNAGEGIYLFLADSNSIFKNNIGLSMLESGALPNGYSGIL